MGWFINLKITVKLIICFVIVAIIAGVIGIIGVVNINKIMKDDKMLYENVTIPISQMAQISELYQRQRVILRDILLLTNAEDKKAQVDNIIGKDMQIETLSAEYEKQIVKDAEGNERELFEEFKNARKNYLPYRDKVIELEIAGNRAGALNMLMEKKTDSAEMAVQDVITKLTDNKVAGAEMQSNNSSSSATSSILLMNILIAIGMVLAILLGLFISRIIGKPLIYMTTAIEKLTVGDLDISMLVEKIKSKDDEVGRLAVALRKVTGAISNLTRDALMLSDAAVAGKWDTRADESQHQGEFRRIVEGVNVTLDSVVAKAIWYEAIIDAVPFPIHVTDNNMNWTYMNKPFEKLMVDGGVIKDRKAGYGKACSNAGANICNTGKCGIKQLQQGVPVSYFDWCGMSCKQDTSYLKNIKGETIGYVEVVSDLTSILRVNEYTKVEVERFATNLDLLAKGDMNMNLDTQEADKYTKETQEEFVKINKNLEKAANAVGKVISDALMLSDAAVAGKLDTRADVSQHQGEFRKIVEGVNNTLDSIIHPVNEVQKVMSAMALNDYTLEMTGQYNGMLHKLADSVNDVRTRLLSVQDAVVRVSKGDISRLEEFRRIGRRSENDKMMPAVTGMMQVIQNLIHDAGMLASAAVNGDLEVRGDINRFEGGYADIIDGMNKTMDAVAKPLQEIAAVMNELEKGNLTISMIGDYKGEYAKVKGDINATIQSFNDLLNEISIAAQQVTSGSKQISDSSIALSQGATEQASSVEELTASLEEISSQTKLNAENANQANELAEKAKLNAVQGNSHMKGMLKAMEDINESSSNISKIIKVIDDIAFQTNMLALNAAVEAARAGQHGKGFAVVAEEVKNLAARSSDAAKETTDMIESSIKKSDEGTKIAKETAEALNIIVDEIEKVANIVSDINIASNEQAIGIQQVNQGIMQVSQVVQTNSATSEESAAASEELSSQASVMSDMVARFKLKNNTKNYGNIDGLSPEILNMLSNMSEKRKIDAETKGNNGIKKTKIVLSDNEFGKY